MVAAAVRASGVSVRKIERLINLIALLMDARRPVAVEAIRRALYADQSEVAFHRMFERDKEEVRELGIPVERAPLDAWEVEEGYRIDKGEALLGDPGLSPDEQAALSLAAQAWQQGDRAGPPTALLKLSLASGLDSGSGGTWILPRVEAGQPNVEALLEAVSRRKRVTFAYRTGGAGEAARRTVDPHALAYRGAWYLAGYDHQRREVRRFKVSRIAGPVAVAPGRDPDFAPPPDAAVGIPRGPWEGEAEVEAVVAFAPKAAWWAERRTGARRVAERPDGWAEVALPVADRENFVSWVLGFGDDAVLESPGDLRADVARALEALASA